MGSGLHKKKTSVNMGKVGYVAALSATLLLAGCAEGNVGKAGVTSTGKASYSPTATPTPTSEASGTPEISPTPTEAPAVTEPTATAAAPEPAEVPEETVVEPETQPETPVDPGQSEGDVTNAVTPMDIEACKFLVSDINQYDYSSIYSTADKAAEAKNASDRMENRITTATASMTNSTLILSLNSIASDLDVKVNTLIDSNPNPTEETASAAVFEMSFAGSQVANTCAEQAS